MPNPNIDAWLKLLALNTETCSMKLAKPDPSAAALSASWLIIGNGIQ